MSALPSFSFKGIEAYSTRAMILRGGITIVADCGNSNLLLFAHKYLQHLGFGPDKLILIKTSEDGDLYQAILNDKGLCARISDFIRNEGYKIEFFCTRNNIEEKFVSSLGLNWDDVISHPSSLADIWNNKSVFRSIVKSHELEHLFPAYCIVNNAQELDHCVIKMLYKYPELVIKRPLWASGLGMVFGDDSTITERYISQHQGVPADTIIERALGADSISMSIVTMFDKGQITDRWFTEQECSRRGDSIIHEGLILGDMPNVSIHDTDWMEQVTVPLYKLVLRDHPQLTGIVNFDCLRHDNERFILECNARITFSTYLQEIRRVLLLARGIVPGNGISEVTCLIGKIVIGQDCSFEFLQTALGQTLLTDQNQSGVIPIVLGCIPNVGYFYCVAIADSYKDALGIMNDARMKLKR